MKERLLWIGENDLAVTKILANAMPTDLELIRPDSATPSSDDLDRADYALNGSGSVDAIMMAGAPHLKLIQRMGAGTDGIDLAAASKRGIRVANLPGTNSVAVAEHTMMLALAASRNVCALHSGLVNGVWEPNAQLTGMSELYGKTFGIIGFGHIGQEVARRAKAFAMDIVYFDVQRADPTVEAELDAHFVQLTDLVKSADVITLHVLLSAGTSLMIGEEQLTAMKPGTVLVNASRSGIVDETSLVAHLNSGHLGGAGIDVWSSEPADVHDPLLHARNVIATPHTGAQTYDTVNRCVREALRNIQQFGRGGDLAFALN